MARKGITVYLPPDLEAKVERLAYDQHRSESSVIAEAVRARLGPRNGEAMTDSTEQRHLTRIDARLDKVIGEALVLKETLLLFVRVWLEHNPPLDEDQEEAAAASAEARFERFLHFVAEALQGKSLAEFPSVSETEMNA
jgi:predicted transcriptional regulator